MIINMLSKTLTNYLTSLICNFNINFLHMKRFRFGGPMQLYTPHRRTP